MKRDKSPAEAEEKAEKYNTDRLKEVGGSMTVADYVNKDELSNAFLYGWEAALDSQAVKDLVSALEKIACRHTVFADHCDGCIANQALKRHE